MLLYQLTGGFTGNVLTNPVQVYSSNAQLISQTVFYKPVRIAIAVLAGIAALAWVTERSVGRSNYITDFVEKGGQYGLWGIVVLAVVALVVYGWSRIEVMGKTVKA